MIVDSQFDTVYHEHLSFFNSKSMKVCANLNGFSLIDVRRVPVHGGSYVFVLKKGQYNESYADEEINKEFENGVYNKETYREYADNCNGVVVDFRRQVEEFRNKGYGY